MEKSSGHGSLHQSRRKILSSAVETVTKLVTPILEEQNFELVEVEFVKEGKIGFTSIYR